MTPWWFRFRSPSPYIRNDEVSASRTLKLNSPHITAQPTELTSIIISYLSITDLPALSRFYGFRNQSRESTCMNLRKPFSWRVLVSRLKFYGVIAGGTQGPLGKACIGNRCDLDEKFCDEVPTCGAARSLLGGRSSECMQRKVDWKHPSRAFTCACALSSTQLQPQEVMQIASYSRIWFNSRKKNKLTNKNLICWQSNHASPSTKSRNWAWNCWITDASGVKLKMVGRISSDHIDERIRRITRRSRYVGLVTESAEEAV